MSLIICSECGKEYSDRANACPNCACPNPLAESLKSFAGETATKPKRTLRPINIVNKYKHLSAKIIAIP